MCRGRRGTDHPAPWDLASLQLCPVNKKTIIVASIALPIVSVIDHGTQKF